LLLLTLLGLCVPSLPRSLWAAKPELFGQYEEQLISRALRERGLTIDPEPEGKVIESVQVAAHEILLPGDMPLSRFVPWTFLNKFHSRTKDYIIAQEMLIRAGDVYRRDLIEESGRNLRSLFILAVARIVAARGSSPDSIVLLVVTKDRWSLRLNTSFVLDNVRLDTLGFSMAEGNLFGRNKRLAFEFALDPGRYALGASYYDPRILSSRHTARLFGVFYLNRDTNALEGGRTELSFGRPLFSLRTRLGWTASVTFLQDIVRSFRSGSIRTREINGEQVPDIFLRRNANGFVQLTYSDGVIFKRNVAVGWRASHSRYLLPDDFPAEISDKTRSAYEASLPRSESWTGPFAYFELYVARYVRLKNIQTFALSEDYRVGPRVYAEVRTASHLFGLPSDFVELYASYEHPHYYRDNFIDYGASITGRVQYETAQVAGYTSPFVNQALTAYIREVTPLLGFFRLHIYGVLQLRARDLNNTRLTLGSDSGLRGFGARAFQGNNLYRINVEARTTALNLWTIHIGGVLFYDAGDTPDVIDGYSRGGERLRASLHQDVGVGLRILFPQFNRDVVRLDLAFPFEQPGGSYAPAFSAEFAQAF
jgi:hypothetical protein